MLWQSTPYYLPLLMAAAASAVLALVTWRRRPAAGAAPFTLLALAVAEWSLGYAFELGSAGLLAKIFWAKVQYLGIVTVPVAWLHFALQYTGRKKWLTNRSLPLVTVIPIVTLLLAWTNDVHGLVWSDISLDTNGPFAMMNYARGAAYWVNILYSYLLLLLGTRFLVEMFLRSQSLYRGQTIALLLGALAPWVGNALYISGGSPFPSLDLTPFGFTLSNLAVGWAIFRFRLLDIVPVARDAVIEGMPDAVIVLDAQSRIVDLNPAARRIITASQRHTVDGIRPEIIGQPAVRALSAWPDLLERHSALSETHAEITVGEDGGQRRYDLRISPLFDRRDRLNGRLVVLHDITERVRAESQRDATLEALRESEERLWHLSEATGDGVALIENGKILAANQVFATMFEHELSKVVGMDALEFVAPGSRHLVEESIHSGYEEPYEAECVKKDGEIFPIRAWGKVISYQGRMVRQTAIRDLTERKRVEDALRRQLKELAILHAVAAAAAGAKDEDVLIQRATELIGETLYPDNFGVLILDEPDGVLRTHPSYHIPGGGECVTVPLLQGVIGLVAADGQSRRISDLTSEPEYLGIGPQSQSGLCVPLMIGTRILGVINAESTRKNGFSEADERLLATLAGLLATAIERVRLFDAERAAREQAEDHAVQLGIRERYLTLLHDVTRAALEMPDLASMLQTLADHLGGLFDADGCFLTLWDETAQMTIPASAYGPLRGTYGAVRAEPGEPTVTDSVLRTGQSLVIEDVFNTPYVSRRIVENAPTCSLLALPLIANGRKLGAALITFDQPHQFTPEEVMRGEQVANHVALAIAKTQLLEEVESRWRETETLRQIGAAVTETLSLDETLERILEQLERVVPYDSASVQLLRDDYLELVGGRGFLDSEAVRGLKIPVPGDNPNTAVIERRKPIVLADAPAAHALFREPPHNRIHSWLGVPLIVHGRLIGMLSVDSFEKDHFNREYMRLAIPFANQASVAIENAQLFETSKRQIQELTGLYDAALATSSALEPDVLLTRLYEQVQQLMAPDTFVAVLYHGSTEEFRVALAVEEGDPVSGVVGMRMPLESGGLTGWVLQQRAPLLVDDIEVDPLPTEPWHGSRPARAWLGVPLIARDQLLGAISVQSFRPHAFVDADQRFLEMLAAQVVIALANAQLYQQAQGEIAERRRAEQALRRRADELAALHATLLDITMTHDLDTLLHAIVQRATGLLDAPGGELNLCDAERQEARCVVSYNAVRDYTGTVFKYGEGATGIVAQTGEPLMIDDYRTWSGRAAVYEEERPFTSVLSAPMVSHGQVIGVIRVHHAVATRRFTQADLDLLTLFANQAAIAVENAHLVEGLEEEVAARTVEILAEQEKSETILRSVGDAIATVDLELQIQYVNDTFTFQTGYEAEEILGRPMCDLMEELQRESCHHEMRLAVASGEIWHGEQIIRRKDGRTYDAALTMAALHDASGRMVGFVSSHRDISRLKDLDRARNQFITNTSHQLRTPLTNMKLYTHLLRKGQQTGKAEDYIEVIEGQIDQLIHLIEDTLEIASIDSGQRLIAWESISPSSLVDELVAAFQNRAEASGLILKASPGPPGLPTINGDWNRLVSALRELLENAVCFTPSGGQVTVAVDTMDEAGREWATISVCDTGPGIPPEEQERVFDRFFRGGLAESGQIVGTGLGLSLAQEIVRAHGGRITLDSQIGVGTTFTLWLPLAD